MKKIKIILIIVIIVLGVLVGFREINKKDNVSETNTNINTNTSIPANQLVKQLYGYITKFNYYGEILVYQNEKVTYENLSNQIKLLTIFENLDENQAEKIETSKFPDLVENDTYKSVHEFAYIYKKEVIEQKAKEIFGDKATVIHENCAPYPGEDRIYQNGSYICYTYEGGGGIPWENSESRLIKAETDGNNIYLYDNYVHMVEVDDIRDGINYAGTYDIYLASDRKTLLAESINLENEGVYENISHLSGDALKKAYLENVEKIIGKELKTFKHTFSKDLNGNYYWVSTEIVD